MIKDWSKAAWNDGEQVAYDHGYIDGKMAGAEDLLAEKDEQILDLESVIDECEAANYRHLDRIGQLETLCRDLWTCAHEPKCCNCPKYQGEDADCEVSNAQRMDALGLLEGERHANAEK